MRDTAIPAAPVAPDEARRQQAVTLLLFLCTALAVTLRIVVSPQMLNRVMDYTSEGGSLVEKLHIGTYALVLLLPIVLVIRPIRLWNDEIIKFRALLRFSAILIVLTAYLFATGRAGASGFLLDSYLAAATAGMIALVLGREARRALGELVLWILLAGAAIGIFETVLEVRLTPYDYVEPVFRPLGLASHPLALGVLCAMGIGFVTLTRWRLWLRLAAIVLLLLGCAASGARLALLVAGIEILALLLLVPWGLSAKAERRAKLTALIGAVGLGTVMIAALSALGLLSRFQDTLFDESFMARVTIYQIFDYVAPRQIMFGMDVNELTAIVNEKLNLRFIESTPVFLIMVFGAFAAALFGIALILMLRRLLQGTRPAALIATITYLVISLSNNALSTKSPELMILTLLLLALSDPAPDRGRSPR